MPTMLPNEISGGPPYMLRVDPQLLRSNFGNIGAAKCVYWLLAGQSNVRKLRIEELGVSITGSGTI